MNSFVNDFVREKLCLYSPLPWADNFKDLINYAGERGFRGVEFLNYGEMEEPNMAVARELRTMAKERELLLPCFSVGLSMVGPNGRRNIDLVKKYAEIASELEIPYLHHTVALRFSSYYTPEERVRYFEEGVLATMEISDYAKGLGVKTIIEDQGYVVNGVENYGRFRKNANECFDVLLDTGNIYFADETAGAFAETFAENIVHTHVKEYYITKEDPKSDPQYRSAGGSYISTAIAGEGDVDLVRVKNALSKARYNGVYSLEYIFKDKNEVERTLEYLADLFGKM